MIIHLVFLIAGFILLVKGADWLVTGASAVGRKLHIPQMVIGLTLVALGTSLPEFFINIIGSIAGKNDIVLGNIIGSNIFNILLILGVSAAIYPIKAEKNTVYREIPFVILVSVILFILANDSLLGCSQSVISRGDGIILFFFMGYFMFYLYGISKNDGVADHPVKDLSVIRISLNILAGMLGLIIGGNLVVNSAVSIAQSLNVSEKLIAVTIIAIGTGLPELFTSLVASIKHNSGLALGNIVGSNIFNVLLVVSASSIVYPIEVATRDYLVDFILLMICSFILFVSMFLVKKSTITRKEGFFFVFLYILYIVYNVMTITYA
ncbi:MAG: calcium/sodium antiporter [Candidatus Delongbacteria bacterium]|nr:calcium/sodium antiporter [Candidatus Delongbacteria bacterium]